MTLAATTLMTAEMLEMFPHKGRRLELVKGELRELMASGGDHGDVTMELSWRLAQIVFEDKRGKVFAAETGFIVDRNPDTVRAPDIAFMSKERIEMMGGIPKGYIPIAPELAVETLSPNDLYTESQEKARMWLEFGSKLVLVLNPRKASITVYRANSKPIELKSDDTLEFADILPRFFVRVGEIFGV
jgi:Uma2 family endonuclease